MADVLAAISAGAEAQSLENRLRFLDAEETIPLVLTSAGQTVSVVGAAVKLLEERAPAPRRRKGIASFTELDSFVEHVNRFKSADAVVFADTSAMALRAVYNYHPGGPEQSSAAWCDHGAKYECPRSPAWLAWTALDGKLVTQEQLATFLEEHLDDLTSGKQGDDYPAPIAMLELARNLQLHTKGRFEKHFDKRTGDYHLVCKQETESTSTPIPRAFLLAIPVFDGGALYKVEARMRCQIVEGFPRLGFVLHRRSEIERDSFGDVRKAVEEKTGLPVFAGSPEA